MHSSADAVPQISHNSLCSVVKRSISGLSAPYHVMRWVIKNLLKCHYYVNSPYALSTRRLSGFYTSDEEKPPISASNKE